MNVLSLFDGISCGQLALNRAGVAYGAYYASEIDDKAIKVTQHHYPKTIQLGDVTKINGSNLPKIDLLMGGSPCQGFSFAGRGLNFEDPRSKLFFEFVRLKNELSPEFFLLENVPMKQEHKNVISEMLGSEPVLIDSARLSKQSRKRLYWTNIPISQIKPVNTGFDKWLYRLGHGYMKDEIKFYRKHPTLAAQSPSSKYRIIDDIEQASGQPWSVLRKGPITRAATPEECEELQTLPIGYTNILNKTSRYKAIGNGWTVDVIAHIFRGMACKGGMNGAC